MGILWVVLLVALIGSHTGHGLPVRLTPQTYPHDASGTSLFEGWSSESGLYAALPAIALVLTAVGLLLGCTWCYRHKDCKLNEGADNQLFTASATHLHDGRRSHPPDSGFSEPANNNVSEDNNNGPISLREMQNIANNNAAAYIVSENEERNRVSRESVVEFEPLPSRIRVADPLERCADWFGGEDLPRSQLQYLREIGRGWFGRVVEGEVDDGGRTTSVAVKILNQYATLEDKARFLDESRVYRDARHENILAFVAKCLQEDPWILLFELCSMDLQQYLIMNRPKMAILNESGVPLQLMCDVTSALAYLHSRGYVYGNLWCGNVLVRGNAESARAVLGRYVDAEPRHDFNAPETRRHPSSYTTSSEVWSLGTLVWEVCSWGAPPPPLPLPPPDLPCPYRNHLYQVMQLCWHPNTEARPTSAQVHALLNHLHTTHAHANDATHDDGYGSSDFEERWQRLKPNTIPKIDEHIAIVHAPSTSMTSHFTGSDQEFDNVQTVQDTLSVDMDTAVSRSSSIMSDKDPLSIQVKSESLTNLHGSLEDVRNIYLTHNETAALECHQANIGLDDREKEHDRSDSSVDPWLKDIIAGSQDDVSYYKDVSDVIKNLDNILNSEKTSSSESSHQASPSRDNLSLDCKKDYPIQSCLVKSPGITNFQNILEMGFEAKPEQTEICEEDDVDRDTIGTLSHSFERHSDTISQQTLENLTPDTPIKDIEAVCIVEDNNVAKDSEKKYISAGNKEEIEQSLHQKNNIPNKSKLDVSDNKLPTLKELCLASIPSISETKIEGSIVREDCQPPCDNKIEEVVRTDIIVIETNSIGDSNVKTEEYSNADVTTIDVKNPIRTAEKCVDEIILPKLISENMFVNEVIPIREENALFQTESNTVSIHKSDLLDANKRETTISVSNLTDKPDLQKNVDFFCNTAQNDRIYELNPLLSNSIHSAVATDNEMNIKAIDLISPVIETDDSANLLANEMNKIEKDDGTVIKNKIDPISTSFIQRTPEQVQNIDYNTSTLQTPLSPEFITCEPVLPPEIVQNVSEKDEISKPQYTDLITEEKENVRSDSNDIINESAMKENTDDSTVYMDLANSTNNEIKNEKVVDNNLKSVIDSCLQLPNNDSIYSLIKNESTVYLGLPNVINETGMFLHSERVISSQIVDFKCNVSASTPKDSDVSADQNVTEKEFNKENENDIASEPKVPDYGPTVTLTKLEQRYVPDSMSPFESPTKSHHTDTYDENSSVVLGPFENCTLELFKGAKSTELVDLPKEELLAFSSNFSEINLETPSPLRDGNFLNEVPDIVHDDLHFDDIQSVSEAKPEKTDNTDDTDLQFTEKRVSPSTPPNSPGNFLASTSQQKYLVDIDLTPPTETPKHEPDSGLNSLQKEIDLNQIELQITTKLAMAENENNMNIEYSGPLTVEGLVSENASLMHDSDSMPETYLAGNGDAGASSLDELRQGLTLDEECVKALRNELELKLPLAQVAAIEPQCDAETESSGTAWAADLPPPPELVLAYVGALSPIAEETGPQLTAYENDTHWNASIRTDSSESYPEPCNNSTDEVTDLLTGAQSGPQDHSIDHTYTIHTPNQTHTVHKDVTTSKEITMSADSLNANPLNKAQKETKSPIDDKTYIINDDEKVYGCERISQVSPFMLSPTTDTSAPDNSDNVTGVSTLSKTTLPTDAKLSKPSETQCLSKATSIDSWCSNDTLYNVEENFDDLAMDPDLPEFVPEREEDNSISSHTLTHDDEKELSHCSTYIVHDSKSEAHESFSPDSITANENNTYTKIKTDAVGTSPSAMTKSDINDSTRNTQTKDLAYGTLMSGLPSYSNCTTEAISAGDDAWKYAQPELVRKTPNPIEDIHFSPPKLAEGQDSVDNISPPLPPSPCVKKMDSIEISCLEGNLSHACNKSNGPDEQALIPIEVKNSPQYRLMAPSITSTPIVQPSVDNDNFETIPMHLSDKMEKSEYYLDNIVNIQTFLQSAELKPQDISSNGSNECGDTNLDTEVLLERESETISRNSNKENEETSATYADFKNPVMTKSQDVHLNETSSQGFETELGSEEYQKYDDEVGSSETPWSDIDASSLLLKSERKCSEHAMSRAINLADRIEEAVSGEGKERNAQSLVISPPSVTNLNESHNINKSKETTDILMTDLDTEEGTEQPHSIIITDSFKCVTNELISNSETQKLESNDTPKHLTTSITTVENSPENENIASESMQPSEAQNESQESVMNSLPNFQTFVQSAELRPQDVFSVANSERYDIENTTNESIASEQSMANVDFEHLVVSKPQDLQSKQSSQSFETEEFRQFENSVRSRPQDLSSLIDASSLLLKSEIKFSELGMNSANNTYAKTSQLANQAIEESSPSLDINPPKVTNLKESHELKDVSQPVDNFLVNLDEPEETDQPHSIIITDSSKYYISEESPSKTYNSHIEIEKNNHTYDSQTNKYEPADTDNIKIKNENITGGPKINGVDKEHTLVQPIEHKSPKVENKEELVETFLQTNLVTNTCLTENIPNGSLSEANKQVIENILCDKNGENYATVNFINEAFEELMESNVDDSDSKDAKISNEEKTLLNQEKIEDKISKETDSSTASEINKSTKVEPLVNISENIHEHSAKIVENISSNSIPNIEENKMTSVTEHFLQNEKKFCQLDPYLPLLSDIRFTGPAAEIMSTSFTNASPTEPRAPETDQQTTKEDTAADILKDWDSDSDSHSSNSSSGEFIWKDGDGHETSVVPSTHFDHQRGSGSQAGSGSGSGAAEGVSEGSGDSGSEGDEVEFVPSSWDCRAAPSKSSLRSLEQAPLDNKKRVVFKRQKYHCVYEYPREAPDVELDSPAGYTPDFSTYSDWESCGAGAREAEAGYGRLFGAALDLYPLRAAALSPDYDEDFFISSSARPFESLGIMSTTSQFFPGMNFKQALLDREIGDEVGEEFPPPPSPLPATTLTQTRTPSLDFTTPDSGVEDITPGSTTTDEDFKTKKLPESEITQFWKPVDSASSSESVSPSSPGGEALGGLRHTRDKLKLDLPPSPHIPSPRHNRVFNFVLDKPKRHRPVEEEPSEISSTPLVMTDETPIITTTLPLEKDCEDVLVPEPTFSTFGKSTQRNVEPEQKGIILTDGDDAQDISEVKEDSPKVVEAVKGEGTVLDSGDEDSGIESSSKATLERNKTPNVS